MWTHEIKIHVSDILGPISEGGASLLKFSGSVGK